MTENDRLLTPQQVADRLQVKCQTVQGWLKRGQIPGVWLPGRDWRVRESELDTWLNSRAQEAKR